MRGWVARHSQSIYRRSSDDRVYSVWIQIHSKELGGLWPSTQTIPQRLKCPSNMIDIRPFEIKARFWMVIEHIIKNISIFVSQNGSDWSNIKFTTVYYNVIHHVCTSSSQHLCSEHMSVYQISSAKQKVTIAKQCRRPNIIRTYFIYWSRHWNPFFVQYMYEYVLIWMKYLWKLSKNKNVALIKRYEVAKLRCF